MKDLVKTNETENKPKNVEEAIKAGWRTAEEMYECAGVCRDTFNEFLSDVRKATLEKSNSGCRSDPTANLVIKLGSAHKAYYHPKVEEAFQAWLMKNQANQGRASATIKEATTQAVEKDLVITEVIKSGNVEAFNQLMNQYKLAFDTAQENKRLLEQTKQMEHALNYTAVIGWKKWSDLKKELAQNFEIFQHRISFKTVAAEAGLVKETDYAERIYGEDCFPTTMISESGIDKIYNCYDR